MLLVLRDAQPEVARRAARRRLEELAVEAHALAPERDARGALVVALIARAQAREVAARAAEGDAQVLRAAVATGRGDEATRDALRRLGAGLGDRVALGRWLDASAVEDRLLLGRWSHDQAVELLARAVAAAPVEDISRTERDELRRLSGELLDDRATRWPLRVEAVGVLRRLAEAGHAEAGDRVRRAARDSTDDPWVQAAALEAHLARVPAPEQRALLAHVLGEDAEAPHRDHVFARARAARLAASHGHLDLLRARLEGAEPSEHVRMEAARGLATAGRADDAAWLLGRLLTHPEDWRVGAAALVARLDAPGGVAEVGRTLGAVLRPEPVQVVLDEVWRRVRSGELSEAGELALLRDWREALATWSRREPADVARLAAVLASWSALQADPVARGALAALTDWVVQAREGASRTFASGPVAGLDGARLLEVLFVLAHEDVDLSARPVGAVGATGVPARGWRITCGLLERRAAWRVAHEASHPRHDKRQARLHTVDAQPGGPLVAWSGRMAEVTATEVPGRRVSSPRTLAWGEHLPLPVNLLVASRHGEARLRTPRGVVVLRPEGRTSGWRAHRAYVALADQRQRLVDLPEDEAIAAYDDRLRAVGFSVERLTMPALGASGAWSWLESAGVSDVATSRELAALSVVSLGAWGAAKAVREARLRRWRRQLQLVVGGWGSRGKSSVERLKAALFHGLGYLVLCKSTGCEAMVLVGIPGADATEVFLYRPRDKATIVEQHTILQLAAGLGAQVTLWECMALNPDYTQILQREWMRDDLTTITNTYPDHEDVQGPSGRDVADVISTVTPDEGHVVTSEHHMTPVLERRARERGSAFRAVRPVDWDLVPRDLLARFPYQEYDRNLALVLGMAGALGIEADVALRTMADHVLTDLGAFKTYGPIDVEGRTLRFVNGCSANDRASFESNWERAGLADFPDDGGLDRFLVVVINNRGDRLARQAMFARMAALDMSVDRLVIIGTNVIPMQEAIEVDLQEALVPRLQEVARGGGGRAALRALMAGRLRRRPVDVATARGLLAVGHADDPVRARVEAWWTEEVSWLRELASDDFDVDGAIATFVRFLARRIHPLPDSKASGDRILGQLAALVPPGADVTLLGAANIKGTGLDLVYRWVSVARVQGWLGEVEGTDAVAVRDRLEKLSAHDGWGLYDAREAVSRLTALRDQGHFVRLGVGEDAEAALATAQGAVRERTALLAAGGSRTAKGSWWQRVRRDADLLGSIRRRRAADRLYTDLSAGRVGLARAALEAKRLVDEEKG